MIGFDEIKTEALELGIEQRAKLAEVLLKSLDEPSPEELERLWLEEAGRRQREVEEGRAQMVPGPEVMRRLAEIG
jgi:hypothetical protein